MLRKRVLKAIMLCLSVALAASPLEGEAAAGERTVLATTFPIYQIVRNVTQGWNRVKVELLLPSQMGCPHDYALTPQDMQKLAKAEILVVNGLGMEEFLGAPVTRANPEIITIDSSAGIQDTLPYAPLEEDDEDDHEHGEGTEQGHLGHHHDPSGVNPHLFVSPQMRARLAMNIAVGLAKADPDGESIYMQNARRYADAMHRLGSEVAALGKRLRNNRIVQPHGVFDYLARDMGLEIVAVMQPHGREPSAAEIMQLVKTLKEKRAGAIVTEPQYPDKIGKTLSKETGIPVIMLDPGASGPEDAALDSFESVMRQNMKVLESALGVK